MKKQIQEITSKVAFFLMLMAPQSGNAAEQVQTVIVDADVFTPTVSIASSQSSIDEDGGTASIILSLDETSVRDVTVTLSQSGDASDGLDYTLSGTELTIAAGDLDSALTLTGLDDHTNDDDETITISISGVTQATLGSPNTVDVTIVDDDNAGVSSSGGGGGSSGGGSSRGSSGGTGFSSSLSQNTTPEEVVESRAGEAEESEATAQETVYETIQAAQTIEVTLPEENTVQSNPFPFKDLEDHWSENVMRTLYSAGVIKGTSAETMEPDRSILRSEILKVALKLAGIAVRPSDGNEAWYEPFMEKGKSLGIMTQGRPTSTATRAEALKILLMAQAIHVEEENSEEGSFFSDVSPNEWYAKWIGFAKKEGIVQGYNDQTFRPENQITRAEAFAIALRIKAWKNTQ